MSAVEVVVWRELNARADRPQRQCSLGQWHTVAVVSRKVLGPVVGTRHHWNGYEHRDTELRLDRQGRTYHMHVGIDYFNNVSWVRDGDKALFSPRLATGAAVEFPGGIAVPASFLSAMPPRRQLVMSAV